MALLQRLPSSPIEVTVASIGTAIAVMVVGTTRITHLRRRTADNGERYASAASRTLTHATRQDN